MKKTRLERLEMVMEELRVEGELWGLHSWFTAHVFRLSGWSPGKATVSRFLNDDDRLGEVPSSNLLSALLGLEEEARESLKARIEEIGPRG